MNQLEVRSARGKIGPYFELWVDETLLAHHFHDWKDNKCSLRSPLGWESSENEHREEVVREFLEDKPSGLAEGRVAVLVCSECGDIECGAITVKIQVEKELVKWMNWQFENGNQEPIDNPWRPASAMFEFEQKNYREQISKAL